MDRLGKRDQERTMTHDLRRHSLPEGASPLRRAVTLLTRASHLLAALALTACSMAAPLVAPTATNTPNPTATSTATATATLTPTATATPTSTPTLTPTPSPTPAPLQVSVSLNPAAVSQGSTCRLIVETNLPARVEGAYIYGDLPFVSDDGLFHRTLLGVSATADIATQPVTLTLHTEDGRVLTLSTAIQVVAGDYKEEYIPLSSETSKLLAPEITRPELEIIAAIYATYSPHIAWAGAFAWPVEPRITSEFGTRRNYNGQMTGFHTGLDLGASAGTPVLAPAPGVVIAAEPLQVRGNAVFVDHGAGVVSGYYHLTDMAVQPGQAVVAGDILGSVGSTGLSTGAHLHWEMRVLGVAVNPVEWIEMTGDW
ncbi:MAG: M23 family metallopeptidase [Anaerolineae bacterium]